MKNGERSGFLEIRNYVRGVSGRLHETQIKAADLLVDACSPSLETCTNQE